MCNLHTLIFADMSADQTPMNRHPEPPRQIEQPHHTPHNTAPPRPLPPQTSVHHGSIPATAPPQATLGLPSPTPSAPKVTLPAKVHLNLTKHELFEKNHGYMIISELYRNWFLVNHPHYTS